MSKTIEALRKRSAHKVDLQSGDVVYVRAMSHRESMDADGLADPNAKVFFAIGVSLVEGDGTSSLPRQPGESAEDYASRVESDFGADLGLDVVAEITAAIRKVNTPPDVEQIAKN